MGWFDRLRHRDRDRDRFADMVLKEMRRAGARNAAYRRSQFSIAYDSGLVMYLTNLYAECTQDPDGAPDRIRQFVAMSLAERPDPQTFAEAAPMLRVVLRGATYGAGGPNAIVMLGRPALPFLDEMVVLDHEFSMAYLDAGRPERWGVGVEEVFAAARANLADRATFPRPEEPAGEPTTIRVIDEGDGYLVSGLLVDGWLARFEEHVGGTPVAFAPSVRTLLVTADEPDSVTRLFETALEEYLEAPRSLSPMAYTIDRAGRTTVYRPAAEHPAHVAAARARRQLAHDEYEHQRASLDAVEPPMAECALAVRPDGSALTSTVWEIGTETLLPEVDLVAIPQPGGDFICVPWAVMQEADLLIEEVLHRPPRYRTVQQPSAASLGYLRERAIDVP